MVEMVNVVNEWLYKFKNEIPDYKKPFCILFILYFLGVSSIVRANYNYLDDIGVNKELLFIIEKVFTNCKNENPYQLLDTLIPYIGKSKAYTHIKNKSR